MAEIDTPQTAGPKTPPREVIEFFVTAPGGPRRPLCVGRLRAPAGFGDWIPHTEHMPDARTAPSLRIVRDARVLFETEGDDDDDSNALDAQRAELDALGRQVAGRRAELQERQTELVVLHNQLTGVRTQVAAEQAVLERLQRETDDVRAMLRAEREFLAAERAAVLQERQKIMDQASADRERLLAQTVGDRGALLQQNLTERERLLGDCEAARERARQEAAQRTAELQKVTETNLNALQLVEQTVRQIGHRVHEQTLTMLEGDKAVTDVLTARQAEQVADLQELRTVFKEAVPDKPAPNPKDEMWAQIGTAVAKVVARIDPNKVGNKLLRVLGEDDPE